jgi:hypothetical protein
MGSSEFEFGALPQWQRDFFKKFTTLVVREVTHKKESFWILVDESQADAYAQIMKDLIDDKIRTKERVGLKDMKYKTDQFEFDCWWDLTNIVAFARNRQILHNLKTTVYNSVSYMNSIKSKGA